MSIEPAAGFLNDHHGITTTGRLDVQVKMKTLLFANPPEKADEGPVALPFNPDENDPSALNPTPPRHRA